MGSSEKYMCNIIEVMKLTLEIETIFFNIEFFILVFFKHSSLQLQLHRYDSESGRVGKRLFACPPIMPIQRGQTIEPFAHPTKSTQKSPDCKNNRGFLFQNGGVKAARLHHAAHSTHAAHTTHVTAMTMFVIAWCIGNHYFGS